jgi:dienelactone hydrolase
MSRTLKQLLIATLAAVLLLAVGGWFLLPRLLPSAAEAAALDPVDRDRATRFLDALDRGDFVSAEAMLAPKAREALSGGKLEQVWTALPTQLGKREERSEPRGESVAGRPLVTVTLRHAIMSLDARIHFDEAGLIDGFRIVPATAAPVAHVTESNERFSERDIEVAGLPATLSLPRGPGPFAGVVLVHGSGPHDRDETIGPNRPLRDLAHGLAERGVAVLRYVKRSKQSPESLPAELTLDHEVIQDAVAAAGVLRSTEGVDGQRVFVLGHSLGGMAAPRILARDPALAGAIIMAGNSRPLHHLVPEQVAWLADLDGERSEEEAAKIAELEQQRDALDGLTSNAPVPTPLMLGLPESYWRDLLAYNPAQMASGQSRPLLILQGDRDYQVTTQGDLARWQQVLAQRDNVVYRRYASLNHLFMAGEGVPNPQEYFVAGKVDAAVIDDIAGWISGELQ